MTQAYPTNFHTFHVRKVLTPQESPADFREITEAEKSELERSDAAWVPWPQVFVDEWNAAWAGFGGYNPETGYGEGNGLVDITYPQAVKIMAVYRGESRSNYDHLAPQQVKHGRAVRTLVPINTWIDTISCRRFISWNSIIEAVRFWTSRADRVSILNGAEFALQCAKLRSILCDYGLTLSGTEKVTFVGCKALERVEIAPETANKTFDFRDSPKLSLYSLNFMVDKSEATSLTVIVHPEVYAKLTDETNTEWHQVMLDAAAKNIIFATV